MQSRFRINLVDAQPRVQYTRKAHSKSRNGCKACKQRRVKCDETRTGCGRCVSRSLTCVYEGASDTSQQKLEVTSSQRPSKQNLDMVGSPNTDGYNLSLAVVRDRLGDILSPTISLDALRSLQHFQTETAPSLGFDNAEVLVSFLNSQAIWKYPFLMHSVLAVTNSHLKRLYCTNQDAVVSHRIMEADHWQNALQLYRREIQSINSQQRTKVDKTDALFATALLSVIFTFAADDEIRPDIITTGDDASILEAFNTFLSMTGFQALIVFLPCMDISPSWEAVLNSADDELNSFSSDASGVDDLPTAFVKLCGLTSISSPKSNVYHKLLRALTPILLLEPGRQNIPKIFAFIGRVWSSARSLITTKDPIALLFLSWWLTQLRQLNLWWTTTRARSQSQAIVNYLYSLDRPDLVPFLEYPATFGEVDIDWIWNGMVTEGYENNAMSTDTILG